jgi:hypothetical protein
MLRRIRKLLSLARDILLTLFSVWWILVGFLNFFFYPLLTVTFGHRPWSGNALWLNWAYLNDVYDLFFRNNPNHGISDVPPPLTIFGWYVMIGISLIITLLVVRHIYRMGSRINEWSKLRAEQPVK